MTRYYLVASKMRIKIIQKAQICQFKLSSSSELEIVSGLYYLWVTVCESDFYLRLYIQKKLLFNNGIMTTGVSI